MKIISSIDILSILNDRGEIVNDDEVLDALQDFYADLYQPQDLHTESEIQNFLSDLDIPTLSLQITIGQITRDEVISAISQLKSGKAPGSDGLTAGFYQKFADPIADILVKVFN